MNYFTFKNQPWKWWIAIWMIKIKWFAYDDDKCDLFIIFTKPIKTTQNHSKLNLHETPRYVLKGVVKDRLVDVEVLVMVEWGYNEVNHEFKITINNVPFNQASGDVTTRIAIVSKVIRIWRTSVSAGIWKRDYELLDRYFDWWLIIFYKWVTYKWWQIAEAFNDSSTKNIVVTKMLAGSVVLWWSNSSLPFAPCPQTQLSSLLKMAFKDTINGHIKPSLTQVFSPFKVSSLNFYPRKACFGYFQNDYRHKTDLTLSNGQMGDWGEDNTDDAKVTTLLWVLIPMVIVVGFLLLLLMVCVCCYTFGNKQLSSCCKSETKKSSKSENRHNTPVIFANEPSSNSKRHKPVLADQICPRTPPPSYSYATGTFQKISNTMQRSFSPQSFNQTPKESLGKAGKWFNKKSLSTKPTYNTYDKCYGGNSSKYIDRLNKSNIESMQTSFHSNDTNHRSIHSNNFSKKFKEPADFI